MSNDLRVTVIKTFTRDELLEFIVPVIEDMTQYGVELYPGALDEKLLAIMSKRESGDPHE